MSDEYVEIEIQKPEFLKTIEGIQRAVEWCRSNLFDFDDLFSINARHGQMVEISFGCCFASSPKRQRAIEALFTGKEVTRTTESSGDVTYKFIDTELQIAFRWHVYASNSFKERETETVIL